MTSHDISIRELMLNIKHEHEANYHAYTICTVRDGCRYEGVETLAPVGRLGIQEIIELIEYAEERIRVEYGEKAIEIKIPIPFATKSITITLHKEVLTDIEVLERRLQQLEKNNESLTVENNLLKKCLGELETKLNVIDIKLNAVDLSRRINIFPPAFYRFM